MDAPELSTRSAYGVPLWKSLHFLLGAWRTITWRQVAWTAAIGILAELLFITVSHAFTLFLQMDWRGRLTHVLGDAPSELVKAFFFLLSVVAAEHAVGRGAARVRSYVTAVLVSALLGAAFDSSVRYYNGWFDQPFVAWWWKPVHPISHFMWYLVIGGFITFVYADLMRARESAARLHAATLRRTQAARAVLQTRLQAMQARVEPQFLFDTLARIKEIYAKDLAKGQRTIDDLIVYLRTAMPQMHDSASTLAREIALVRAYVQIVAACSDDRISLAVEGSDDWTATPFPPMLLLPLVEHAVARGRLTRPEDGVMTLSARRTGDRLQVAVGHGGSAFATGAEGDAVRRVREHLRTLFEGAATLERRARTDGGTEMVMETPG